MSALESLGRGFIGAVGGFQKGVEFGQEARARNYELQDAQKKQEAQGQIKDLFKQAADKGGLSNMDDDWFAQAGSAIAGTGDYAGAANFSQLGSTIRASKSQASAARASSLLGLGNLEAAIPDINESFKVVGGGTQITGLSPDGTGFVMSDGHTMTAEKLQQFTDRMSLAPKDAIKAMVDKAKADAEIGKNDALAGKYTAEGAQTEALTDPKVSALEASAGASRASAGANVALTNQRNALTPSMIAENKAQAQSATASAAKSTADASLAAQKAPSAIRLANAQATKAEAEAANPILHEDPRGAGATSYLDGQSSDFDRANKSIDGEYTDEAMTRMAEPHSPLMAPVVKEVAAQILAKDPKLGGTTAGQRAEQQVRNFVGQIQENNPEITDSTEMAEIAKQVISFGEVPTEDDADGTFVVVPTEGGAKKIYLQRKAAPEPAPSATGLTGGAPPSATGMAGAAPAGP